MMNSGFRGLRASFGNGMTGDCAKRITLEAFACALLGAYIAITFGTDNRQESVEGLVRAIVLGNIIALIFVGFVGVRISERRLFSLGIVVAVVSMLLRLEFIPSLSYIPLERIGWVLSCGASTILILAWCDRIAQMNTEVRLRFLSLYAFLAVCVYLLMQQVPSAWSFVVASVVRIASGGLGFAFSAATTSSQGREKRGPLPKYVLVLLFLFGFMIGGFFVAAPLYAFTDAGAASSDSFAPHWVVLAVLVTAVVWVFLFKRDNALPMMLVSPLLCLGLLALPLLGNSGNRALASSIIAFLVICEMLVFSIGPSERGKVLRFGRFSFIVWGRSLSFVGLMAGSVAALFVAQNLASSYTYSLSHVVFAVYCILGLTTAALLGIANARLARTSNASEGDLSERCKSVARQFGLTARETEVFELIAQGRSLPYIQEQLHIAGGTVATHSKHIYQKLGVHTKQELIDLVSKS